MCSKIQGSNVSKLVGYTYPKLHKGKEWYVDFYALDPATDTMRRKKYSISTEFRVAERNRRATEIINVVSSKLMKGWNPWVQTDNSRAYVLFEDCLERYLDYVDRMDRKKTRQSYHSRVNVLKEYIATRTTPFKYAYQFDESFCNDFIDWMLLTEDEYKFARASWSHVDFLIENRVSKKPVLVIEVDGFAYHHKGTKQEERDQLKNSILDKYKIPVLRLSTTGSGEIQKIENKIRSELSNINN